MLRHLSQAHDTTCISCHPYVFYKKVFLNNSQNSQENNCAGVSNSCNFNKKEALAQEVSCEPCKIFKNMFFIEQLWRLLQEIYSREQYLHKYWWYSWKILGVAQKIIFLRLMKKLDPGTYTFYRETSLT